jgi:redox-sensitive bicupin YhaK (pirin superfamily)
MAEGAAHLTLLAGTYGERTAPARLYSPLLGLDIGSDAATTVDLQLNPDFEYGLLPLVGEVAIDEENFRADEFAYLGRGRNELRLNPAAGAKVLFLGGQPSTSRC